MRRRDFLPTLAAGAAITQLKAQVDHKPVAPPAKLKQTVTAGVFPRGMPFEETCQIAAKLGIVGYDLRGPQDWPTLKKYGLTPTMYPPGPSGTIPDALNRKENHDRLEKAMDAAITICMEYLNSKVNHKDYMFDHMAWGVNVMKRVNSPRVRILYDIYHAQIMDGDVVRNIRENFQWIGH